jgi:hypothetical protein
MTRRRLEDERTAEDYAGDQPQGPGPDDDDRIPRRIRRGEGREPGGDRRGLARGGYFRWLLESAAATPRLM